MPGTDQLFVSRADVREPMPAWAEAALSPLVRDTLMALLRAPVTILYMGRHMPPDAGFSRGLPAAEVAARALVDPDRPDVIRVWGTTTATSFRRLLAHEFGHVFNAQYLHDLAFQDVAFRIRLAQSGSGSGEDPNEYFANVFRDAVLALRSWDGGAAVSRAEAGRPGVALLARYLLTLPALDRTTLAAGEVDAVIAEHRGASSGSPDGAE